MILKRYLTSLSQGGSKRTDDILASAPGEPVIPGDLDKISYRDIVRPAVGNYEVVDSGLVDNILTDVWVADGTMWDATEKLDVATKNLKAFVDNALRVVGSSVSRIDSVLRSMTSNSDVNSTFDSIYVERFDVLDGTNSNETTAVVSGGHLELPVTSTSLDVQEPEIISASCTRDNIGTSWSSGVIRASVTTDFMLKAGIEEAREPGLVAALSFGLDGTKSFNALTLSFPEGGHLIEVFAIVGGTAVSLYRPSSPEFIKGNKHLSVDTVQATQIRVIAKDSVAYVNRIYSQQQEEQISKLVGQALDPSAQRKAVLIELAKIEPVKITYTYSLKVGVTPKKVIRPESSIWTSKPITIDGNIRLLKIDTTQTENSGSNTFLDVSVNGGSWKRIVRSGDGSIVNEPVSIGPDGRGYFRHKANPEIAPEIVGAPPSALISWIHDTTDQTIIGAQISGMNGGTIYSNYTASDKQQFITFDDVDTVNGIRVVDAMTNGQLGEKFASTVEKMVRLSSDPASSPDVYVSGVKAVNLNSISSDMSLDDPTLDINTVYFRVIGRRVVFSRDHSNISVYYKHMRSSLIVRATLNRGLILSATPRIDTVAVGIVHN